MAASDQPGGPALAERLQAAARAKAKIAVQDLVTEFGGQTIRGPLPRPRSSFERDAVDPNPIACLEAARELERAAHAMQLGHIREAREAVRGWYVIGESLGLHWAAVANKESIADEAYDYALRYDYRPGRRTFAWTCSACQQIVTDHGPWPELPKREEGHADGCTRWAADLAEWQQYRERLQ